MISSRSPTTFMEEWEDVWHDVFYLQGADLWAVVHGISSPCPINSAWVCHLRNHVCKWLKNLTCNLSYRHFVILQKEDFRNFLFWRVFCFLFWIQRSHIFRVGFSDLSYLRYIVSWCWMTWFISVLNMVQDQWMKTLRYKGINSLKSFSVCPDWCFSCCFICCVFCVWYF